MPVKRTKLSKRLSKRLSKSKQYRKTKNMKGGKQRFSLKIKKVLKSKKNSKNRKHYKSNSKKNIKKNKQKGGFFSDSECNLATIKEPGFNLEGSGDIEGIKIPDSRAVIYNPDCKVDDYQAMTPYN